MSRKSKMRLPAEKQSLKGAKERKDIRKSEDEYTQEEPESMDLEQESEDDGENDQEFERGEERGQFADEEADAEEDEADQDEPAYEQAQDEAKEAPGEEAYSEEAQDEEALAERKQADEKAQRRIARRKRRIRNQIMAYIALIVFVAGIAAGALFTVKKLLGTGEEPKKQQENENKPNDTVMVNPPDVITQEPTPTPTPQVNPADEVARYYIAQMTLEEKVAGLFFVRPEDIMTGVSKAVVAGNKTKEALGTYAIGGLIYFSKNIQTGTQITDMLNGTREMSKYPIFFGIDEEGGSVAHIADALREIGNTGDASAIGASGDTNKAYAAYYEIATYLVKFGFNVDFAPVADVYDGEHSLFAKRSFGTDPEEVKAYVYQAVCGLQDNRISACLKHFPGIGRVNADPHNGMAVSNVSEEELIAYEILPFQMALAASPDFVMVSNGSFPGILADNTPACMSSDIVTRILRDQLGYEGIVITDAMDMAAVADYYTSGDAAVSAILAGCDMVLMPENFKEAYQGVLDAVRSGRLEEERIDQSLMRIYRVKCAGMTIADVTGE